MSEVKYEVEVLDSGFIVSFSNGETIGKQEYYAAVTWEDMKNLQGKILTIIDAGISDKQQNKALKDLLKRAIWFDWAEGLFRGSRPMPTGVPRDEI